MTGIGMKRDPNKKRTRMRRVSKKQAKKNSRHRQQKEAVLNAMHEKYGRTFCMGERYFIPDGCGGSLELDHVVPRSRRGVGSEGLLNKQLICEAHHRFKTTTPTMYAKDFRNWESIQMLTEIENNWA